MHVLRTGCQWTAFPRSVSGQRKRFLEWERAGFFGSLWKAGLAGYDDMAGIV